MANQIIELELHTICGGQLCVNVLHFRGDTAQTDMFQLAKDAVINFLTDDPGGLFEASEYMFGMAASCFLSLVSARTVGSSPGPRYPKVVPEADFPGGQSGELYSQSVACNLKLVTASGPDLTGRIFYPGVPEDALVRNRWTTAYQGIIAEVRDSLLTGITIDAVNFNPVVYSETINGAEDVSNIMLVPNPATQRRRVSPV